MGVLATAHFFIGLQKCVVGVKIESFLLLECFLIEFLNLDLCSSY